MDNNMTLVKVNNQPKEPPVEFAPVEETSDSHFLAANTKEITMEELSKKHTIPVFAKDNESTIAHQEFVETVSYVTDRIFGGETILKPAVRASHPIKGRIPSAVGKPAKDITRSRLYT